MDGRHAGTERLVPPWPGTGIDVRRKRSGEEGIQQAIGRKDVVEVLDVHILARIRHERILARDSAAARRTDG
ncbi:hypothetical protein D3C85_1507240 [compost metagenome]